MTKTRFYWKLSFIKNYLDSLNWPHIITENYFDLDKIKGMIIANYELHAQTVEKNFNNMKIRSLFDAKETLKITLNNYMQNLPIFAKIKSYVNKTFITDVITKIDMYSYLLTDDFQSGKCLAAKAFCFEKLNSIQIINIPQKHSIFNISWAFTQWCNVLRYVAENAEDILTHIMVYYACYKTCITVILNYSFYAEGITCVLKFGFDNIVNMCHISDLTFDTLIENIERMVAYWDIHVRFDDSAPKLSAKFLRRLSLKCILESSWHDLWKSIKQTIEINKNIRLNTVANYLNELD